jgi:hypothetical protein
MDLDAWSKLRKHYFSPPYDRIYDLVSQFYDKFNKLPTFAELQLVIRNEKDLNTIKALEFIDVPEDLDTDIILQALINEYAQKEVLEHIDNYIDNLPFKDATEDYTTFEESEILERVPLGINNDFDNHSLGLAPTEYILFGGHRGTGKSLICSNIACNQYLQNNSSLYFSIEMSGKEIFHRNLSILSDVPIRSIKSGNLNNDEKEKIARLRASMTEDGGLDLLDEFYRTNDFYNFERKLLERPLRKDKQIITIHNPRLTLSNIDATIAKFKAKFNDGLKIVMIDYLNQIEHVDSYKWDVQVLISKKLKELASKYNIVISSPYQSHKDTGEARFAKGILDSADWAFTIKPYKKGRDADIDAMEFICQKARGEQERNFVSGINWNTLRLSASENPVINKMTIKGVKPEKTGDDL